MGELSNCPNCGALFVKGVRKVCDNCYREEERAFETVYAYIRKKENRRATITEVSEGTGVEERLIMKFVKEKRLQPAQFPNLTYGCERCGNPIQEGKICGNCRDQLKHALDQEQAVESIEKRQKQESAQTYFTVDKKFNRR
ncbi:flagellar operon protein TIGR03826 [Salinibacillus kushneri]|uniref:Flagellar operon protein TIGR03826 n=1 Tax=Salinibacillus kushneri TaxID=237682 RepID=A0A1H9YS43_9BACI|nr:TIGR03826 family flagellar region protein [Salinibacillus kushneri]SES71932.1 flagellar operon protein TIGR03826 [Salinibacillus kushneri]